MQISFPTSGLDQPCAVPNFTGIPVVIAQPAYSVYVPSLTVILTLLYAFSYPRQLTFRCQHEHVGVHLAAVHVLLGALLAVPAVHHDVALVVKDAHLTGRPRCWRLARDGQLTPRECVQVKRMEVIVILVIAATE